MKRIVPAMALLGIAVLALGGMWLALVWGEAGMQMPPEPTERTPLLMLWYLVYGYDWSTGECKGGPTSVGWERPQERVFSPQAGYYCSSDPSYIAAAINQMKEVGVTTLLLSWHGWGDVDFDGDTDAIDFVANTTAVVRILEHVRDHEPGMKLVVMVEPFFLTANPKISPPDVTVERRQVILDYVWDNFYNDFSDQIFQVEGKPLVVNWKNNEGRWPLQETADPRFAFREWGVIEEGGAWEFTAYQGLDGMKIGTDGAIWIAPRFDEFHLWNQGAIPDKDFGDLIRLDPYLTDGLYDRAWEKVYRNRPSIKMVMLYGWNGWAEAASIEPAAPYGDLLLRKTHWYYHRFINQQPFQEFNAQGSGS